MSQGKTPGAMGGLESGLWDSRLVRDLSDAKSLHLREQTTRLLREHGQIPQPSTFGRGIRP